jgi:hypothetical protein
MVAAVAGVAVEDTGGTGVEMDFDEFPYHGGGVGDVGAFRIPGILDGDEDDRFMG